MKKYLIPDTGKFYKANLHCHTTFSDGALTPEQVKQVYMEQGYSIVAFTDHNVFIHHPELADDNFLPMNGFEIDITDNAIWGRDVAAKSWPHTKTCHICFVALRPDIELHPMWHRTKYLKVGAADHRDEVKFDESLPDYERYYTPECISDVMRLGRENGFFVTYNHPKWSMETYAEYSKYYNMHAIEIYNHSCVVVCGVNEYNPQEYDEMLRDGKRIYCLATDDNHAHSEPGSGHWDCCGGYVMIKAEKLDYETIGEALLAGNFYASRGPEIKSLWFDPEDSTIHVECSDAEKITCVSRSRINRCVYACDQGKKAINEASFKVRKEDGYVRITVWDEKGLTADTNAYFVDDLLK